MARVTHCPRYYSLAVAWLLLMGLLQASVVKAEPVFYKDIDGQWKAVQSEPQPSPTGIQGAGPFTAESNVQFTSNQIDVTITYVDVDSGTGVGFDDPTEGQTRRDTMQAVVDHITGMLNETGSLEIEVKASETDGSGALASASAFYPSTSGFHGGSAFEHLTSGNDTFANVADTVVTVDFGHTWNSSQNSPGANEVDLFSVLLHELTHGLGIRSLAEADGSSAIGSSAFTTYDELLETSRGTDLYTFGGTFNGSSSDLISDNVVFVGIQATQTLDFNPGVHSPSFFERGSSISHWDVSGDSDPPDSDEVSSNPVMAPSIAPGTEIRTYNCFEARALIDIGYANTVVTNCPGAFRGTLWDDADRDGIQDGDESGREGVTVTLFQNSTQQATDSTDSNGDYQFQSVDADSDYQLVFDRPTGRLFTTQGVGSDETVDSDVNGSGEVNSITLSSGETLDFDAGTVPIAENDTASVREQDGDGVPIDVAANDDSSVDTSTLSIIRTPDNGNAAVEQSKVRYTPDSDFDVDVRTLDTFDYGIDTSGGDSGGATVTVTIKPNEGPIAGNDSASTDVNTAVTVNVLSNDSDSDGTLEPSSVTVTQAPSNGSTQVNGDGSIQYTPDNDFSDGDDTFTYQVADSVGDTDTATVTVSVAANQAPIAEDDSDTTAVNTAVSVDVLSNDSDPEGDLDAASVTVTQAPANGSTQVNGDGSIQYAPGSSLSDGDDTFTYQVADGVGDTDTAKVTVSVAENQVPLAIDDSVTTAMNTPVTINVLGNDSDSDGSVVAASVAVVDSPENGAVTLNNGGNIRYTPATDFNDATDSFLYRVRDNLGAGSNMATVTVTVGANQAPVASDDTVEVQAGQSVTIDVRANDLDPDGALAQSQVELVSRPVNGQASVTDGGLIRYQPEPGFAAAEDRFSYRVLDELGAPSETAQVVVNVNGVSQPDDGADFDEDDGGSGGGGGGLGMAGLALLALMNLGRRRRESANRLPS